MDNITIKKLEKNDVKEIDEVAEMLYNWWGNEEGYSIEAIRKIVESRCNYKGFPVVYIAKTNSEVVGTISLIANDTDFRQDLFPMISSVIVKEKYRKQGIAQKLIETLINDNLDKHKEIFLVTDLDNFYEKLGFKYIETSECFYNIKEQEIKKDKIYTFRKEQNK